MKMAENVVPGGSGQEMHRLRRCRRPQGTTLRMWSCVSDEFGLRIGLLGRGGGRTPRLDVVAIRKGRGSAQRCVAEVAVGGGINSENKVRKPHEETRISSDPMNPQPRCL